MTQKAKRGQLRGGSTPRGRKRTELHSIVLGESPARCRGNLRLFLDDHSMINLEINKIASILEVEAHDHYIKYINCMCIVGKNNINCFCLWSLLIGHSLVV